MKNLILPLMLVGCVTPYKARVIHGVAGDFYVIECTDEDVAECYIRSHETCDEGKYRIVSRHVESEIKKEIWVIQCELDLRKD
jgi:hypothetical protein